MTSASPEVARAATWATVCSGTLVGAQVAGKATRDALFLSSFAVTSLPVVLIVTSIASIAAVLATSRATSRWGPRRVFFYAALVAAALHGVAWVLVTLHAAHAAALVVYVQTTVLGAIGISVFWSRVNEVFDPRSAKTLFARIGGGGTLGGLIGGLLAERVATHLTVASMLPVLAALQVACAATSLRIRKPSQEAVGRKDVASPVSPFQVLANVGYLRDLAGLVVVGTLAAALLDYVFKAQTAATFHQGPEMLRAFAVFYAGAGLLTFLAQMTLSSRVLDRGGIGLAVSTLPSVVAAGGIAALVAPGLASATIARGLESVMRSSVFRSGYELFYTPIPTEEKRGTKPVIDVGFDRLGDVLGGAVAQGLLLVAPALASRAMLVLAVVAGGAGLLLARRLGRGYVQALERGLMTRALELDLAETEDQTTRSTLMKTLGELTLDRPSIPPRPARRPPRPLEVRASLGTVGGTDVIAARLAQLRAGDAQMVRSALAEVRASDIVLVPQLVSLLAWDEVAQDAAAALSLFGARIVGQLVDTLLDPKSDFAVRRRVPRVLAASARGATAGVSTSPTGAGGSDQRAIDGLLDGLGDRRFEVRFQCARALLGIQRAGRTRASLPALPAGDDDAAVRISSAPPIVSRERVLEVVERELRVSKRVWESQRILDRGDDAEPSPFVDEALRDRASRSLEHVFTLLSLVFPESPLRVAFRGLHTTDRALRGTALEYLDSVLPDSVGSLLLPLVEAPERPRQAPRQDQALRALMLSRESIDLRLAELTLPSDVNDKALALAAAAKASRPASANEGAASSAPAAPSTASPEQQPLERPSGHDADDA